MNMDINTQLTNKDKKIIQSNNLIRKVTLRITTYFKNNNSHEIGSGTLYRTSDKSKFDYVFTALHCIRGDNKDKKYHYEISDCEKIKIEYKFDKDTNFTEDILTDNSKIIEYPLGDFAIILISKKIGDFIEKKVKIPEYYILNHRTKPYQDYRASGYPAQFGNDFWTCDAKLAPNGDGEYQHELIIQDIADQKAIEKLGGFSGSGFFLAYKPILGGFARSLRDKSAYTNRLNIGRIDKININALLANRNENLESVKLINNSGKIILDDEEQVINFEYLSIEGVNINLWNAIKRVKEDLKDDWFEDPQYFEDMLNPKFIYDKLSKYLKNSKLTYKPDDAVHFNVPKKGFTCRIATEINIVDRVVYQAFIDCIIEDFNEVLENNVYSARFDTRNQENTFFINSIEQWKKFSFQIGSEINEEYPFLVVADITSFYDNINIDILAKQLKHINYLYIENEKEKKVIYDKIIEILKRILNKWSKNELKVGIPQNKDTSTFLANMFLAEVDKTMINNKYKYYRFNDDIRIICKDKFQAQKALMLLINELNKLHLNLNSSKTAIFDKDDIDKSNKEKKAIEKFLPKSDRKLEQINSLLSAKKARDVQIATILTYDLFKQVKENSIDEDLKDRYFNFYIDRLQRFARNPFLKDLFPFDEVTDHLVVLLTKEPWNSDKIIDFFKGITLNENIIAKIKEIIFNPYQNIYDWQSYLIWLLFAYHKINDADLIDRGMNIIDNPNTDRKSESAAVSIYLATVANPYYISKIKTSFDEDKFADHFTQRNVLIAMKKIHYEEFNETKLKPCLRGVIEVLNNRKGDYIKSLPTLNPHEIYSDLPNRLISL